jgi:hypothetical protein
MSEWSSTPRERRKRKPLTITLSDEERDLAERLAAAYEVSLTRLVAVAIAELSRKSGALIERALKR